MEIKELCHQDIFNLLPDRPKQAHKGNFGKILMLCGSKGYTGAPALAALGALRVGAGLVYLGVPECIYEIEAIKLTEPVIFPVSGGENGFSACAEPEIREAMEGRDAVLIGPGIGQTEGAFLAVKTVLSYFSGPVVLDADGINVITAHKNLLRERTSPTILTPHTGEFSRLGGNTEKGRLTAAAEMAAKLGVIVVLKGYHTVITDGTTAYVNPTGNPGMAVGGSGDVLAGVIAGLLGQGLEPLTAAACGAWLHGAAGDLCAARIGQYGMLPGDLLDVLPELLR